MNSKNKYIIFFPGDYWFAYMRPHITNYIKNIYTGSDNFEYYMYVSDVVHQMTIYDENTFFNDDKKCNLLSLIEFIKNNNFNQSEIIIFTPGYSNTYHNIDPSIFANKEYPTKYIIIRDERIVPVYDHNNKWFKTEGLEIINLFRNN
jgi:hypothetical protein